MRRAINRSRKLFRMAFVYSEKQGKKVPFYSSIIDLLGSENEISISVKQQGENVAVDSDDADAIRLPLRRPSFCPFHQLANREIMDDVIQSTSNQATGIPVASAILLEWANEILLTRRAAHMRSFPTVWVPPGGHVDPGETLEETAFRELAEETGLVFDPTTALIRPLCAWESTYPTQLSLGQPRKHHLVLYYLVRPLLTDRSAQEVKVNPGEVDAFCWIDRRGAEAIAASFDELGLSPAHASTPPPDSFRCYMLAGKSKEADLGEKRPGTVVDQWHSRPFSHLTNTKVTGPSDLEPHSERVSTGTKFALYQWLLATRT